MAEQSILLEILRLVFSGPGAVILGLATLIILMLIVAFSTPFRELVGRRSWKFGYGNKMLETSPADQLDEQPVEEHSTDLVKPAIEGAGKQLDLQEVIQGEEELLLEAKDDSTYYRMILIAGHRDRDAAKIEEAYQEWRAYEDSKFSDEEIETLRCQMRLKAGVQVAESELKKLEQDNATWVQPSRALAEHFVNLARYDLASPHAQIAIDRSGNDVQKAYSYQEMADILVQMDSQADALVLLNNSISKVTENESKARILDKIAEIHSASKDKIMAEKALEHALKINPNNKDRRFKLAYTYSDHGQHHLALFHYRILTEQDPRYSSALNNLGVSYGKLDLPGKCVETWKRAASFGEIYPMGNLAIELLEHGFYEEARKILDDVPVEHRDVRRVVHAIGLIDSNKEREDRELNEHVEAMKLRHKYMLLAVESEQDLELNKLTPMDLVGDWTSASGAVLKIGLSKGTGLLTSGDLQAELTESSSGLGLGGFFGASSLPSQNKFNCYLSKNGLVLTGTGYPLNQQPASTILGGPQNRDYFIVVIGKVNIRGLYWSDYKYPHEISFNRS